ncbi:MAG: hypothetical protein H6719_24955 [Sandaracinaceae bacterium]|nr:hypothetical protein [Sandaracinaceae bacterium]
MATLSQSTLLLEEHFENGDDRFLDALYACTADGKLKALAPRWIADPRPWARKALLAYVDDGCDRGRHRALVRALLRLAEERKDDRLMAHLFRAFDGMDRHEIRVVDRWSWQDRETRKVSLRVAVKPHPKRAQTREFWDLLNAAPKNANWRLRGPYFSRKTRAYLRRRAFRWLRAMAYKDPARFLEAAQYTLSIYTEADVEKAEHVVDVYGLTNLLYYGSDVLVRSSRDLRIAPGRQLLELAPAPLNPDAWRGQAEPLLRLLFRSDCLYVRRFLERWLEREEPEALASLRAAQLKPLLMSPYGDVQVFAANLVDGAKGFGTFRVDDWMDLLGLDNLEVLPKICALVERYVTSDRLGLEQLVHLGGLRAAPTAELALRWLKERSITTSEQLATLMALADAESTHVREEAVRWLLEHVRGELGTADHARMLVDARHPDVREIALSLMAPGEKHADDPALWLALSESPYPEVRAFLVKHLEARMRVLPPERVAHVWASTLLSPYRGSRAKRRSLEQIATRVVAEPARADELLPILRVALRSVREAERRSALAAVARAAFEAPALLDKVAEHIPELELGA